LMLLSLLLTVLAFGPAVWAVPGQSPVRQTIPTRTPTLGPVTATPLPTSLPPTSPPPPATPTATPSSLMRARIWLDAAAYSVGDTQTLYYDVVNPLSPLPVAADAYLLLHAPDGRVFYYGPRSMGSGLERFTTRKVPVVTMDRVSDRLTGTAARFTVPPLQPGTWRWEGMLVTKGLDPSVPANRLSNVATASFVSRRPSIAADRCLKIPWSATSWPKLPLNWKLPRCLRTIQGGLKAMICP